MGVVYSVLCHAPISPHVSGDTGFSTGDVCIREEMVEGTAFASTPMCWNKDGPAALKHRE